MNYNFSENIISVIPAIISFAACFLLLLYILYQRYIRGKKDRVFSMFLVVILLCVIWTFGNIFEGLASNIETYKFWIYIEYFSIAFMGLAWLSMSMVYVKKEKLLWKLLPILIIPPTISYLLVLTNNLHYLFFIDFTLEGTVWGVFWWMHTIFSYIFFLVSMILYISYSLKVKRKRERIRTMILLGGALVPLLGNMIEIFILRGLDIPFDLTPVLFTVSSLIFAFGLFRYGLFDIHTYITEEIMANIISGVVVSDLSGKVVDINPAALKILEIKKSDVLGKKLEEIDTPVYLGNKEKIKEIADSLRSSPKKIQRVRLDTREPKKRYFSLVASSVVDKNDNVLGYLYLLDDVTESYMHQKEIEEYNKLLTKEKNRLLELTDDLNVSRKSLLNITEDFKTARDDLEKANEKLKRVDEMRKEFVSHTAHELRTPLNIFRWTIEMLKNEDVGEVNSDQRELLENLAQSNRRLLNLVNNLLEVSRMDQGRFKIVMSICDLPELIDQVLGELAMKIRQKSLFIRWKKPSGEMPKIKGDCERIIQVLMNIINNSVKYTPDRGMITINVEETDNIAPEDIMKKYGYTQKNKKYLLCSIKDTGVGIPKKEQDKMFSRFFRASNVVQTKIEGTGLGMTITKSIIDMHSGAIWFESDEDKGTSFYFTVPVAQNKKTKK